MKSYLFKRPWLIYVFVICVLTFIIFSYKITEIPPAINGDEIPVGLNAILISRTLHDENGRFLPVFISAQNLADFKQPVTTYATTLAFKIFGPSYTLLRQVSILFALLSFILIFFLIKELINTKAAILGSLIFLTTPTILIQSHLALENIAPVPLVTLWLWMLIKYQKTSNPKSLIISGVALGIGLYSYPGMRLITPTLFGLTVLFLAFQNKKNFIKPLIFWFLGFLPFILVLPILHHLYPGAILAYNRPATPSSYQDFLLPYLSFYDLSFLFLTGDATPYHSTGKHGMYLLASLPLFLIGIYQAVRQKSSQLIFILICFFTAPILYGLTTSGSVHRGSRLLALVPFYTVLCSASWYALKSFRYKLASKVLIVLFMGIFILNYFDFVNYYWFNYPQNIRSDFPGNAHLTFAQLSQESKKFNLKPVIQARIYHQEGIAAQFFEQLYFPGNITNTYLSKFPTSLSSWDLGQEIPAKSVLLVFKSDQEIFKKLGKEVIDSTVSTYVLVINK